MKAKLEMGVFGAAPAINATLPKITSVKDDVAVASAIGAVGGGVQRLLCSTAFYFGNMSKEKDVKGYKFDNAFKGYHDRFYPEPLKGDVYRRAKANVTVYAKVARLPYETRELAERMFDHPHGSQSQKATALNKLCSDYEDEAPTEEQFVELLPKKKAAGASQPATLKARASAMATSVASIRDDEAYATLKAEIEANDELQAAYDKAVSAIDAFANLVAKLAKAAKDAPAVAPKATKAQLAAGLAKNKPGKGEAKH